MHYLGAYGSAESREKYGRLISQWCAKPDAAGAGIAIAQPVASPTLTVEQVIAAIWIHAQTYFRKNGGPTSELAPFKDVLKVLPRLLRHDAGGEVRAEGSGQLPGRNDPAEVVVPAQTETNDGFAGWRFVMDLPAGGLRFGGIHLPRILAINFHSARRVLYRVLYRNGLLA